MDPLLRELVDVGTASDEVELILKLRPGDDVPASVRIITRFGDIVTCRVQRGEVAAAWTHPGVLSAKAARLVGAEVEPALDERMHYDVPLEEIRLHDTGATGRGVVVGIVDWGLDVAHPNFRAADGGTRVLALWDQGARRPGAAPEPYGYGIVHTRAAIDRALQTADPYAALDYHPGDSDPFGDGAHGTHVADIAAGSGHVLGSVPGVAPRADIVFVQLAAGATGGIANLGDTSRIVEALDFIARIAGPRPWVVNLSVGRCGGPHTGLTLVEQGMDQLLAGAPGRAICQSTGNYFATNGHAAGQLRPGESRVLTWLTDRADVTPNEMEIWYSGRDAMTIEVRPPNDGDPVRIALGEQRAIVDGGRECGRVYHRRHDPSNGDHHVDIFLDPRIAPAGAWRVTLIGEDVVDGRYDAWLERDSACPTCQSRFDGNDAVALRTTGTICNAFRTIAVGAYDPRDALRTLATFSSAGPTRDGRQKPDCVAPGVRIVAARSAPRRGTGSALVAKSGTSMAAPYVTGTIACMFEVAERPLWIHETRRLLLGSARGVNGPPNVIARVGSGYLDPGRAITSVRELRASAPVALHRMDLSTGGGAMTTPDLPASEDISDDDDLLSIERAAEDDEEDEDRPKRHFILVSGGPGPYDTRDIEHDASWANYVTPPLLLTDTKAKRKAFRAADEEVAWLVYKPAYERRWTADSRSSNADRKNAVRKIKDQGFASYVDLIAARAKERGWSLHWLMRGADLWTKLKTFEPKSISRLCYWGHARDDLWLSIEHHPTSGSAIEPKIDEVITVGAIDVALKNRFQSGHWSRLHRFVGCNTKAFATAWAKAYGVWAEGVVDKVQFKSIHTTGGEPCLANAATVNWFKPGGSVDASQSTTLPACSAVGISESFIAATAVKDEGSEGLYDTPTDIDADDLAGDGAQLVDFAEAALHGAPAPLTAAMLLERALEYSGMSPPDAISRPGGGLCLTSLYGALTGKAPGRRSAVDERFEVVAAPGGIPSGPFAAGDILLRRPPGQPRLAHVAILVDGEVITDRALVPRRWEAERAAPGGYALVVEGGAFPHCRHREFARRVLDARGCVPAAQVVIRIRPPGAGTERLDGEDVGATVLGEQAARATVRVRNRLRDVEPLADCVVELVGTLAHGVTKASGRAEIDLAGVADGRYMLSVLPANRTTDPVGPSIASATPRPQRIWRPLDAQVTVVGGRITASTHADVTVSGSTLTAKVQPVWMASNRSPRRSTGATAITHIVIHHTGGPKIDRALDDWVTQRRASTHYVIDVDGQIIKLVHEADAAWHAGPAHWDGRDDLNDFTIAIEIVNAHPSPFTAAQYDALIELLGRIRAAHPDIPAWNVIGHSDIATCPAPPPSRCASETVRRLGRKWTDHGDQFEWERLERLGLGMIAAPGPLATTAYGGFLVTVPAGRLRQNDRDSTHRYGGAAHPTISGVIGELQSDLRTIGYLCPATGVYDRATEFAVHMFHEHFFAGTRPRAAHHGQVDEATATRIKGVLAAALVARIGGAVGAVGGRLLGGPIDVLGGLLGEAATRTEAYPAWPVESKDAWEPRTAKLTAESPPGRRFELGADSLLEAKEAEDEWPALSHSLAYADETQDTERLEWGEAGAAGPDASTMELVIQDAGARAALRGPALNPPTSATASPRYSIGVVDSADKPLANARWAIYQDGAVYQGTLDSKGWTSLVQLGLTKFDGRQPFRIHVEGHVCSIVRGATLLSTDPAVEYGGQFLDWSLADAPALEARAAFWQDYAIARKQREALDVFQFLQHDHVMRRPVKLLARESQATFEARPIGLRLGPLVRYADERRALVWMELQTPGLVRVHYGKATAQDRLPLGADKPASVLTRHAATVRVGGRHYALVCLDRLEPDTAYLYSVDLGPLPATGPIPIAEADFTEAVFPRSLPAAAISAMATELGKASFRKDWWLFFRTMSSRVDSLRFAHGSCRKWPGDADPENKVPGPDMLEAFGSEWLAKKAWSDWPRFFLHSGDQIYADDVGVKQGRAILRHRFAASLPGPAPTSAGDVAFGAWSGRFGFRYFPLEKAGPPPPADLNDLRKLRPRIKHNASHDIDYTISEALRARKQAEAFRRHEPGRNELASRPLRFKLRVLNALLWHVPDEASQVPRVDKHDGLRTAHAYRAEGPAGREYRVEHPCAGETEGVHAADYAEYAALYEQAWSTPSTRKALAHVPSYMIFDDHEVTDDWNADPGWTKIVHSKTDPHQYWPTTMTDALAAYWIYQGWGNLPPEDWKSDPRVQILDRCKRDGRDALAALRRLIFSRAVQPAAPGGDHSRKLAWHYALPTGAVPFLVIDLRTDRDVNGSGGLSTQRLAWIEQKLLQSKSPVAFIALAVPFLMPDPMLFAFRNPWFTGRLAGARSTVAFKRGSDLEHPAESPVWDQVKGLLGRLQRSSSLKTIVMLSGDIHFSCNLDGQLPNSSAPPRLLQLVSSGLQQQISTKKQDQLASAYKGWLNAVSRAQGVDTHRGVRITLGGLHGPGGKLQNFLFRTSVALVDLKFVNAGRGSKVTAVPLIVQTHLTRTNQDALVPYSFRHMTQPGGTAVMTLKDPGFAHPSSPTDYPATAGGIGLAEEFEEHEGPHEFAEPLLLLNREVGGSEWEIVEGLAETLESAQGSDGLTDDLDNEARYAFDKPEHYELDPEGIGDPETDEANAEETFELEDERSADHDVVEEIVDEAPVDGDEPPAELLHLERSGLFEADQSSLEPGQSIVVDGQQVRTYADAVAWYTLRRDVLESQKRAFVKDGYLAPDGLDDLTVAANARIKMMRKLGSQPMSDSRVEGMLGWRDVYVKVLSECDSKMETIAADRFRATRDALVKLKEQATRLLPQLREFQRSAFRKGDKGRLKQGAETFATWLDIALVAEQWMRDAVTKFDDIKVLGTTLRTQKALHGSSQPWHELMRETTNARVAKLLSVADGLNKALAGWQLFDASLAVISGGKTSSDRTSAGIALASRAASAGGTLLGASGFFSLYTNLYIGPMVGRILGQIDQLKDRLSTGRNRPYIQLGSLDQVDWSIEPGGREMYEFMHGVMRAHSAADIKAIPAAVGKYFSKHQADFDAGAPRRHGVDIDYADVKAKREWIFGFRDDIWGMLYGAMPVPRFPRDLAAVAIGRCDRACGELDVSGCGAISGDPGRNENLPLAAEATQGLGLGGTVKARKH